jgi:peptidoglycan DL-endopeptidase LytF
VGKRKKIQALISLFIIMGVLFATPAFANPVEAQTGVCGTTYVVQPGDTFFRIAQRCGVTLAALQAANPQISNINLIFPGQVLNIPGAVPIPPTGPQPTIVQISPVSGPSGTQVTITGSNFEPNRLLHVGPALLGQPPAQLYEVTTDADGDFQVIIPIPDSAQLNQTWVFIARDTQTNLTASSGTFFVTDEVGQVTTYTVQFGDTLASIAQAHGTTVQALLLLNPQIVNPNLIIPGQVIRVPVGIPIPPTGPPAELPVHIVARGETLFRIALRYGTTVSAILQVNPEIVNPNRIFPGQAIRIPVAAPIPPTGPGLPIPPTGDLPLHTVMQGETLFTIAQRYGTTVAAILQVNPQITNPNLIFAGQQIRIPSAAPIPPTGPGTYVVRPGDTLSTIAVQFGTTVQALLLLNPQIVNPNVIEVGQVIRIN